MTVRALMTWRWAVVTATTVPVCNMMPSMPGEPPPPGFKVEDRQAVKVLRRCRSRRAAERSAPRLRDALLNVGQIGAAHGVEVWARDMVEQQISEWKAPVRRAEGSTT